MMAAIFALTICTALALTFSSTRGIGILGLGILILLFPVITTAIVLIGAVAYFVYHRYLKGN
jgi:hypothetical protein